MFLSTFEKQLDSKRRIVVPVEFRAAAAGPFEGIYCFPSIEADCIEAGGQALLDRYLTLIDEFDFGDELRSDIERTVLAEVKPLSYDTAGRITLPDSFCRRFGLTDWVAVVGLGDRFQIWNRDAFMAEQEDRRLAARKGLIDLRNQQRRARLGSAA